MNVMSNYKLFLSHSSKDAEIVNAFVNFMYKVGLTEENIICTSSPGTKITIREDIYDYLNNQLSQDKIYVIFFLSDNYYASTVCLNEMGAAWLKKSISLSLLLPGFTYEDIQGVVGRNKIGIQLGTSDSMTKASFNDFKKDLEQFFQVSVSFNRWEAARDEFLSVAMERGRLFNMKFSESYCIGDLENNGCKIIRKFSNKTEIVAEIDFQKTNSKLCSVVVFTEKRNFVNHYANKRSLCFEAYADGGIRCVDVEFHLKGVNRCVGVCLDEDEKNFTLPLLQFCDALEPWKNVTEIAFLFRSKNITEPGAVTIKNLRLE